MRNLLFKDSLELERTDACTVKSPWLSCWQMQSKTLNERCQALAKCLYGKLLWGREYRRCIQMIRVHVEAERSLRSVVEDNRKIEQVGQCMVERLKLPI